MSRETEFGVAQALVLRQMKAGDLTSDTGSQRQGLGGHEVRIHAIPVQELLVVADFLQGNQDTVKPSHTAQTKNAKPDKPVPLTFTRPCSRTTICSAACIHSTG